MGNSPKKQKVEKSKYVSFADKWSPKNIIKCPLNNYGEKVVDVDCISLNGKECLLSVLTKQNIIFETFSVKGKKQKKLDIKTLFAIDFMVNNDARNVIIHRKMKNVIAVSFNSNISIYEIDIEHKSYELLLKLLIKNEMECIQNNMYFVNNHQIIYTSLNGNIFIYDFMEKQLINTIKLSSIVHTIKHINCIDFCQDFGLDLNINPKLYCIFAKKLKSKQIDTELVYLLNITNCIQSKNDNNHQILSLLNSETNKFESIHDDENKQKQNECRLKIFKQIQCVSFSPNMEFLAVACGSSIDLFYYQQKMYGNKKEFVYVDYHNYGAFISNIKWMNDNLLIVITNNISNGLIITSIKLNKQEHIINIIIDIFKELGLTDDIIDVMFGFLEEWDIKHQSIPFYGGGHIQKKGSLLKSCIDTNDGRRGAIVIGGQLYPELLVSVVD